jgi:hypothetical protein
MRLRKAEGLDRAGKVIYWRRLAAPVVLVIAGIVPFAALGAGSCRPGLPSQSGRYSLPRSVKCFGW